MSGLFVAYGLRSAGVPCTLFEASARVGGVVRSTRVDGRVLEWGPQRLRLTADLRELVDELGIADELLLAPDLPLYIVRDGRMHEVPRSLAALVGSSLLSPAGRLRVLLEPLTGPVTAEETVAGALRRKFGDEAYRVLLGPLLGGLYASDPANMRARDSLKPFVDRIGAPRSLLLRAVAAAAGREAPPACSFREGLGTLPVALARAVGSGLKREHPVTRVLPAAEGGRWVLSFDTSFSNDRSGEEAGPFTDVVLAVPASRAAEVLEEAVPESARRLGRLTYNRLAIVHLAVAGRLPPGLGYQVAFGEPLETRGVTFNDPSFGREGLATAFLGGARNPRLPDWPDERIAALGETELERIIGRGATTLEVSRAKIPAYDTSWEALDDLRLPAGVHLCAGYIERAGVTGRLRRARRLVRKLADGAGH